MEYMYFPFKVITAWRCSTRVSGFACAKALMETLAPSVMASPVRAICFFIRFSFDAGDYCLRFQLGAYLADGILFAVNIDVQIALLECCHLRFVELCAGRYG